MAVKWLRMTNSTLLNLSVAERLVPNGPTLEVHLPNGVVTLHFQDGASPLDVLKALNDPSSQPVLNPHGLK